MIHTLLADMLERLQSLMEERDEAQAAAETYHAAWQDAAVYWKESVKRLESELLGVYRELGRLRAMLNPDHSPSANSTSGAQSSDSSEAPGGP